MREIVRIDENKCDGCGLCVPACAEGAIQIIDGKAKLLADNLCDGLGACLGHCPKDAIIIEKRAADEFDEDAVEKHLAAIGREPLPGHGHVHAPAVAAKPVHHGHHGGGGCPGSRMMQMERRETADSDASGQRPSELQQWPVQLHLVPPTAPFLQGKELLLAADCVPFAYADFHKDMLKGKALLIGCPKLDDGQAYLQKLIAMFQQSDIKKVTVARMEVPCCGGLQQLAQAAIAQSGKNIPLETLVVSIQGEIR